MSNRYSSLDEATTVLLSYAPATRAKSYDLSIMKQLMAALDNPQDTLRVIHVAGTSGKTSTCYYIRGLLEAAGHKTGLTVSPHIVAINERVQVSGVPLDDEAFLRYFELFMDMVQATELKPSYYELTMALAYYVFAAEDVEYAIIETGLGGLLDGSNIATREDKICVIQRIGYDHTEILGNTLPEIALQKAGIIHEHNTVFVLEQIEDVDAVIANYASQKNAEVHRVAEMVIEGVPVDYQNANWCMAYAVYQFLVEQEGVKQLDMSKMETVKRQTPPGRYEVYRIDNKTIILDGAHNGQKLTALVDAMKHKRVPKPVIIFSLKDSDIQKIDECMSAVSRYCKELVITTFNIGQDSRVITNADVDIMLASAKNHNISARVIQDQKEALAYAEEQEDEYALVTGSLYLVSEIRRFIAG